MARACPDCIFYSTVDSTCRRQAPIATMTTGNAQTVWPVVRTTDWCGDGYNAELGYYGASSGAPPQYSGQ